MSDRMDKQLERLESRKKLIARIQDSIDDAGELNDWETEFLDSIMQQVVGGFSVLSDRQMDTIDKIEYIRAEGRDAWWEMYRDG